MRNLYFERTEDFDVRFHSYSGMESNFGESLTLDQAHNIVRHYLRTSRKMGCEVVKTGKGIWEIQTPEDARMVSDREGILTVSRRYRRYRRILGRKVYLD